MLWSVLRRFYGPVDTFLCCESNPTIAAILHKEESCSHFIAVFQAYRGWIFETDKTVGLGLLREFLYMWLPEMRVIDDSKQSAEIIPPLQLQVVVTVNYLLGHVMNKDKRISWEYYFFSSKTTFWNMYPQANGWSNCTKTQTWTIIYKKGNETVVQCCITELVRKNVQSMFSQYLQ